MAKQKYEDWNPRAEAIDTVRICNDVLNEMRAQGYTATLRQLYYQLVTKNYIPNNTHSYDNLGAVVTRARMAGLMDWDAIEDRGRAIKGGGGYDSPAQLVGLNQWQWVVDRWEGQNTKVEVWVEKEALIGVISRAANRLNVPSFACKGYVSASAMRAAAERHIQYEAEGHERVVIIHLGDHDPSGLDMTRDIQDRLETFGSIAEVQRIALNRDQIDQYQPPPNPAKITDSRSGPYIAEHGRSSWELDALPPALLDELITGQLMEHLDVALYNERVREQNEGLLKLQKVEHNWPAVETLLATLDAPPPGRDYRALMAELDDEDAELRAMYGNPDDDDDFTEED